MNAAVLQTQAVALRWTEVCSVDEILPNTGVCALVNGRHVAVFRVGHDVFYAIDNVDPKSGASVLSRGLVGNLGDQVVVASPLYKNHFDLQTGQCLEAPEHSVNAYPLEVRGGLIWVSVP